MILFTFSTMSQVPQGFNYQAVARDETGAEIINTLLPVRIGILSSVQPDVVVWEEEHQVLTSNYGIINIVIGDAGAVNTGGSVASFSEINWLSQALFVRTQVYYLDTWNDLGSAQLWSVPYSMVSKNAGSLTGNPVMMNGDTVYFLNNVAVGSDTPLKATLAVVGDDSQSEDALFEVRRQDGEVVFAVYNQGVRINMPYDPAAKGPRGGFAIGGFDRTKGLTQDYLRIDHDSIRLYINDLDNVKGPRGGFAVGGFDKTKGVSQDYLLISEDSVRLYITDSPVSGEKGGFAVSGFNKLKAADNNYLEVTTKDTKVLVDDGGEFVVENVNSSESFINLTPENYFIGHQSGINTTTGQYNSFIGYRSGTSNTSGSGNIFLGYESGVNNTEGMYNVFIGNRAGYTNIGQGSFIGDYNVFLGYAAGYYNTDGQNNVFVGKQSGWRNTTGRYNTFTGQNSGIQNIDGNFNTYYGGSAGEYKTSGSSNTMIGYQAGANNGSGSNNVFIGTRAGNSDDGSNKFYLMNGVGTRPMLYGDFITTGHKVVVNGDSIANLGNNNFFVSGSAGGTSSWQVTSDIRLKKDIESIENPLGKVLKMRGVNFRWKDSSFDTGMQMGFIGQETATVIPEIVNTNGKYLTMEYAPLTALLVEAVKEQNTIIESQKRRIEEQEIMIQNLAERLTEIEAALSVGR